MSKRVSHFGSIYISVKLKLIWIMVLIFLLLVPLASGISKNFSIYEINEKSSTFQQEESDIFDFDISIPGVNNSNVIIDGEVTANEYNESFFEPMQDIQVYWEHNGVNLTVALISQGTGWISLGIGDVMKDSNMIMGGADSTTDYSVDLIGLSAWGHEEDTANIGNNDILDAAAIDDGTSTTFEFIIPLNSSDPLDPPMEENNTYSMFFGYQTSSDTITAIHTGHSAILSVYIRPIGMKVQETSITVDLPSTVHENDSINIVALLTDKQTNPIPNITIEFYSESNFGDLIIGVADTNSTGGANFTYHHPTLSGNFSFGAKLRNKIISESNQLIMYKGSYASQSIIITPKEAPPIDPIRVAIGLAGFSVATVALFVVWAFYGYNVLNLFRFLFEKQKESEQISETPNRHFQE
ncbi:MAG: DOMON domain-containing protein [Candidatus Hodarchaeales archaeon]